MRSLQSFIPGIAIGAERALVVALLVAAGAVLAPGQQKSGRSAGDVAGMQMNKARNVRLTAANDESQHVLTFRLGPLRLPADAGMNVAQAPDLYWTVPFDGWFTAYHPRLEDASGNTLPPRLLHHVAIYDTDHQNLLCSQEPEHIFGAGGEMADWPGIPGLGYRVRKGDRIKVSTMFHNDEAASFPETYLEVKINYQPLDSSEAPLLGVRPVWFDVKECGSSAYDLKPGRNVTTGKFTLGSSGRLVGVGGHLHDYGRELILEDDTTRRKIADLKARLDAEGRLISVPIVRFTENGGFALAKGDSISVTAFYDNPTGRFLPQSAMGIIVGYFLPYGDGDYGRTPVRKLTKPAAPND